MGRRGLAAPRRRPPRRSVRQLPLRRSREIRTPIRLASTTARSATSHASVHPARPRRDQARVRRPRRLATPTYPYCQWLVGSNVFLALTVEPRVLFNDATADVNTLDTITGLGQQAIIANNRYLYFTEAGTTYWLLWQQVGDFSSLNTGQLVALAHDVLAHVKPREHLAEPPAGPPGPPIYFAGDSTAAGPDGHGRLITSRRRGCGPCRSTRSGADLSCPVTSIGPITSSPSSLPGGLGSSSTWEVPTTDRNCWSAARTDPSGARLGGPSTARVGSVTTALRREGAKVLWIGEPAMHDPQLSADMRVIDQVCAERPPSTLASRFSILA